MPGRTPPERPVLVAPDRFGRGLRASEVAAAIGRGLERAGLRPPDLCPVADGGEGTTDVLVPALGGEIVGTAGASFALLDDGGTALVEWAGEEATGEAIRAAVEVGAHVILLASGRSPGADGAAGAMEAIAAGGGLGGARLVVLCPPGVPGSAAAAARWRSHGAVLERGGPWVLDALDFNARMRAARAVVTGENTLDRRSLEGRLVGEIGQRTRQAGVPLHAVVGRAELDLFGRRMLDLQVVLEADTLDALEAAGERLGSDLAHGRA